MELVPLDLEREYVRLVEILRNYTSAQSGTARQKDSMLEMTNVSELMAQRAALTSLSEGTGMHMQPLSCQM